ncbi:phospholipase D-like domain-containing protein [Terrarubrum flagellatum]|uniref:phospholipase D-like domain-containing protein n=1 Tax=Terrirubrum flagellatum TaxID=2895980 RepID=UPI0031450858
MKLVKRAGAWCNGEVAYIAWDIDEKIDDCLGFMVTRIHLSGADKGKRRILPTWVAFQDQNNPNWNEQDSSVWPIQRFEWRDLTLRKSRDTTKVRPIDFQVHYEIVPVGLDGPGRTKIPASPTAPEKDPTGQPSYEGPHRQLFQIGEPTLTDPIDVTHDYGDGKAKVSATFTNGILSTQNMVRQLESVGKAPPKKVLKDAASPDKKTRVKAAAQKENHLLATLKKEIVNPKSDIRSFLTGDVLAFLKRLLERAEKEKGEVYLSLYELHDPELIELLLKSMKKGLIHIILSTAGNLNPNPKGTPKEDRQPVAWDTENDDPRRKLHALETGKLKGRVIDRMFNTSARIGHNKFAVLVKNNKAVAVLSGSTNWTETGLCTQSNNSIIIEDADIANDYWDYWKALSEDKQPKRVSVTVTDPKGKKVKGAKPSNGKQGKELREENEKSAGERSLGKSGSVELWRSPNTEAVTVPKNDPERPPDLSVVYEMMDKAKQAIMFLTFLPGLSGKNNIIGEAALLAEKKKKLFVMGAVSDPKALPPPKEDGGDETYIDAKGKERKLPAPAIWWPGGDQSRIVMIRAAAVRIPFGNLRPELLTAGHAIIHDKIIVIDPLDEKNCAVITGSHNLGYKASYCNDDNLLIVRGNRPLAISYAVHVIDLYDHYVFRARLEDNLRDQLKSGKIKSFAEAAANSQPHGLLRTDAGWQDKHFKDRTPGSLDYFLGEG